MDGHLCMWEEVCFSVCLSLLDVHACTPVCDVRGHCQVSSLLCATLFFQTGSLTDLADRLLTSMLQGPSCLRPSTLGTQLSKWLDELPSKL